MDHKIFMHKKIRNNVRSSDALTTSIHRHICSPYISLIVFFLVLTGCAHMQVEQLFTQGQYAEAEHILEQKIPDITRAESNQLVWLCHVRYKLKKYSDLFACLDHLEKNIQKGDRYLTGDIGSILGTIRSFPHDLSTIPHLMRAEAYIETGRYDEASREAAKAYEMAMTMKWPLADLQINWERICRIRALGLLAMAHAFKGNQEEASRYTEMLDKSSIGLSARYVVEKEKALALGRAYMAQKRYDKVLEGSTDFLLAFAHFFTLGIFKAVEGTTYAYVELPKEFVKYKALFETGQVEEAKTGYDRLLGRRETKDNGELYWSILFDRGRIHEREGETQKALEKYREAINVIESQRSTINNEASKIGFVGDKQGVYHRIVDLLYSQKDYLSAFAYAERAKARALVDLLASSSLASRRDPLAVDPLVVEVTDLERREKALDLARLGENYGEKRVTRSIQLREKIKSYNPELASLVSVDPPTPGEIQSYLGAENTLVEYFHQGDDLFIFVLTASDVKAVKVSGRDLHDKVKRYREELQRYESLQYRNISRDLYATLVAPVRPFLKTQRLMVVPHGILHYLPFNSLLGHDGYLAETFSIALLPSASVLKYLKGREKKKSDEILIFANPDLGDARYALRYAELEGDEVSRLFPQAKKIIRANATKSTFKTMAGNFAYIHIAAHGIFNSEDPLNSGIMLAREGQDDGLLRVTDLYELCLNADLVTLSACETALGKVNPGDDVVGLTRGFIYAGANSIIASLWPVDDEATATFMTAFYSSLKTKGKADALREAQLTMMKRYPHPYFWAPFQLTGVMD